MFDWSTLLDEAALATVLPGEYSRFVRPVCEGLLVFLSGLPEVHREEILAQQAALPASASISQRLAVLARACPVLHKLGQVLARDPRLAPELRQHLCELETVAPTVPWLAIQQTLARELGSLERLGIRLAPPALAEASVAVVVPFESTRTAESPPFVEGVFKILKPGIEERLYLELDLLTRVATRLDDLCAECQLPPIDYQESFEQIRDKLMHEVLLEREQQQLQEAARGFRDMPQVHIPALLDYCTPRVTAMERIMGGKITDRQPSHAGASRSLAELVVQALIARPIFCRDERALFHCDPHAGNLFLTDDNRLAILDWSLVGHLNRADRTAMALTILSALNLDAARISCLLEKIHRGRPLDRPLLQAVVRQQLARLRPDSPPGLTWLIGLLDESLQRAGLRVDADLMLFRKCLHTLEGVVTDIHLSAGTIDSVLWWEFWQYFSAEWVTRWLAPLDSRAFATHLSNLDLLRAAVDLPATAARWWMKDFRHFWTAYRDGEMHLPVSMSGA